MKIPTLLILSLLTLCHAAYACPGCVGSNPQDKYLVYILGAFILLTYIPFFFLFRLIKKNQSLNAGSPPPKIQQ